MTDRTKTGAKMNPATRSRIIELLTNPEYDGVTQAEIATEAGISERTLRNYLTSDLWEEVRQLRLQVMYKSLALVDRAIFNKASHGDIHAAKLIYARWDSIKDVLPAGHDIHNLTELDSAIEGLEQRINDLEHAYEPEAAETTTATEEATAVTTEQTAAIHPERQTA